MYRYCISFFVCLIALAACSPRVYHGERVAKASVQEEVSNGTYLHDMVSQMVQEEVTKQLQLQVWTEQVRVHELLSRPDSSGNQYVTERTNTTTSMHSKATSYVTEQKNDTIIVQRDSTTNTQEKYSSEMEKMEVADASVKGWMPWWVYVVALVGAAIIGLCLYFKFRKL